MSRYGRLSGTFAYGLGLHAKAVEPAGLVTATHWEFTSTGIFAELQTPWGRGTLTTRLLGRFNLYNLLAVLAALCSQGYALEAVLENIAELTPAVGRMHAFGGGEHPLVVVDYAHTPDCFATSVEGFDRSLRRSPYLRFLDAAAIAISAKDL